MRRMLVCLFSAAAAAGLAPRPPPGRGGASAGTGKALPLEWFHVARDFKVELVYTVPRSTQGSWVSFCAGPGGTFFACDQGGAGLYRVIPSRIGENEAGTRVEKLPADISGAQGLLWAFDSLYVMVNGGGKGTRPNGLYRVRASKPGGLPDAVEQLRAIQGSGEHGPHGVVLSPDGQSLFCVCGNSTRLTRLAAGSQVPQLWADDNLFPLVANFGGVAPEAGCVYKVDPDGKNWQLWTSGFRNQYDAAFNRHGDLFTYDSDMEWDQNLPWYRPTRACLTTSGGDLGFRNGSFVFPPRYPDNLPAVADVGPGSPTGVCFGYGAKFPTKYQEALFVCDWSFGRLFAVHLSPDGSAYKGELEEIVSGSPLALTDLAVNPGDGALYFAVGGRGTQSAVYRLVYAGKELTTPSPGGPEPPLLKERRQVEAFHGKTDPKAVEIAWPYLGHADRFLRYAARVAVEHQPVKEWQDRALAEANPVAATQALLALARVAGKPSAQTPTLKAPMLAALDKIDWQKLTDPQRDDLVRVYAVLFSRLGPPDAEGRERVIKRLDPLFPAGDYGVNADLCQVLVYLDAPGVAEKALKLMAAAPSQEEQIAYALSLSNLKEGWTPALNQAYFQWFRKAAAFRGGQQFANRVNEIRRGAMSTLTAKEREELGNLLTANAPPGAVSPPRPVVKKWTLDDLAPAVEKGLAKRDFDRGRQVFGEAKCFTCHRFGNEGGALAPDLTVVSARLSARDLLEKVIDPNKAVSDQYANTVFTLKDGRTVVGRVANLQGENMQVQTDMLQPARLASVNTGNVESAWLSTVSPMPAGLLDPFKEDEVLDLLAYVLSRGDRGHTVFKK